MTRRGPGPRATRALVGLLAGLLLVAGCATFGEISELDQRLGDDGFAATNVSFETGTSGDEVTVASSGHRSLTGAAATERAVEIVWRTFPRYLDTVNARVGASGVTASRAEMEASFGPRDPALDAATMGDDAGQSLRTVGIVVAVVGLVLLAGIAVLVVWLVRRARRRRPGPPGPYPRP